MASQVVRSPCPSLLNVVVRHSLAGYGRWCIRELGGGNLESPCEKKKKPFDWTWPPRIEAGIVIVAGLLRSAK